MGVELGVGRTPWGRGGTTQFKSDRLGVDAGPGVADRGVGGSEWPISVGRVTVGEEAAPPQAVSPMAMAAEATTGVRRRRGLLPTGGGNKDRRNCTIR
jgi:hypothetical protein